MGPLGSRHDFISGDLAIEVKTTLSRTGTTITIHGLDQLDAPLGSRLVLVLVRLEQIAGGGMSVSELGLEVQQLVDAREFASRLARAGFLIDDLRNYDQIHFRSFQTVAYTVEGGFPRLTRQSLLGGNPPAGVQDISYRLDLAGADAWVISDEDLSGLYRDIVKVFQV
jgi:hypothetical protein